mgnify:CR=1 FL=1
MKRTVSFLMTFIIIITSLCIPVSAKSGKGVDIVISECERYLNENDWFFPEDIVTDQPEKQIAAEIIREKLLWLLDKEIPHGIAIVINKFELQDNGVYDVNLDIICERANHKAILIGKQGRGYQIYPGIGTLGSQTD